VRDKSKIPSNKLFEMERCFFLIDFFVESEGETIDVDEDDEDPGQSNEGDKLDEDADLGDDFKAFDKSKPGGNSNKMETDPSFPSGGRSVPRSAAQLVPETSVQNKVFGKEPHIHPENAIVLRSAEANIGNNLLQHFEEEEDDDAEGAKGNEGLLSNVPEPSMPSKGWKEKKQWGLVQATRMSSRIPRDGKTAIEKAQNLKMAKNLEIPKGNNTYGSSNSFAALIIILYLIMLKMLALA
jgi:hypothetical protein